MIAGTPHYSEPAALVRTAPTMTLTVNPMHAGPPLRALLTAMQSWITTGVKSPASRVPMRAHGTMVEAPRCSTPQYSRLALHGHLHRSQLHRYRRFSAKSARGLSGVRAACRRARYGHCWHSHVAAGGAVRNLYRLESACAGLRCRRAVPVARRGGAVCVHALSAMPRAIRGHRSPSAIRTTRLTSPRLRRPPCRWSPSVCCYRKTPSAPLRSRSRTHCRG